MDHGTAPVNASSLTQTLTKTLTKL